MQKLAVYSSLYISKHVISYLVLYKYRGVITINIITVINVITTRVNREYTLVNFDSLFMDKWHIWSVGTRNNQHSQQTSTVTDWLWLLHSDSGLA